MWRAPYQGRDSLTMADFTRLTKAPDLRPQGWHATRDIVLDSKGTLYLAVGARDDVSEQPLPDASIQRIDADGAMTPFATGLRNVEGLAFYPGTDNLWITVNERDKLGARTPSDFLAQARQGDFFGWPYAYNGPNPDPVFGAKRPDLVAKTKTPDVLLGAHTAPLGLVFYTGTQFPAEYRGDAFVAIHGSGPYDKLDGYKVVRVRFKNGVPVGGYEDFITGFSTTRNGTSLCLGHALATGHRQGWQPVDRGRQGVLCLAGERHPEIDQLASAAVLAKGLSPSQVPMSRASARSPVSISRLSVCALRTVSSPIQIAVMVLRSVAT